MSPRNFEDVQSPFIADRIRETRWQHRQYILDLLKLKRYVKEGGPHSWGDAMWYGGVTGAYPTELRALKIEHLEGRHVTTEEYRRMQDEDQRQRQREAEAAKYLRWEQQDCMETQLAQEFTSWRRAGGQP